jgi:hypothetical protein
MILYTKNVISDKRKLGKHFVKKKEKIINTVFGHELYKSWIMERNLFIVIIMILCLFFFIPKQNDYISSKEDAYYRMFIKEYSGEATADKLESIRGKLTELESLNAGEADDAELKYWDKTPDLDDSDSIRIALEEIEEYGNYLLQNGGSFMLDEGMALASGTGGNQEEKILFLISAFIVIFMTANVWSVEYDSGMNVLINISYAGGKKITNTKKLITAINIILVFVLINFSFYYSIFSAYGTHGILYPACSVRTMSQIPAFISILTYLIIKNIIKMFILCVTGALVLSISKRIKNYTGTLAATCVIFVVVIFICLFL